MTLLSISIEYVPILAVRSRYMRWITEIKSKVTLIFYCLISLFIISCGGGGKSSQGGASQISPTSGYTLTQPNYTGLKGTVEINPAQASEIVLDIASGLDLLTTLVFSDDAQYYHILPFETTNQIQEIVCDSGTFSSTEITKNKHIRLLYDKCALGAEALNGQIDVYLVNAIDDSHLDELDWNINLVILDLTDESEITLSGNSKVRRSSSGKFYAEHQILLKEGAKQLYFDKFITEFKANKNRTELNYIGDVYISDVGLILLKTEQVDNAEEHDLVIVFSSKNTFSVEVKYGKTIIFKFGGEYIPFKFDLNAIPVEFSDGINETPVAMIDVVSEVADRGAEFEFSSLGSYDLDMEPLIYKWEILQAPIESNATIIEGQISRLLTDLPGYYKVGLTVTDLSGASHKSSQTIQALQLAPNVTVFNDKEIVPLDGFFSSKVTHNNEMPDQPITYRIAYGPPGMTVNESGVVTWNAHIPSFGFDSEIHFAIEALNKDKMTLIKSQVIVNDVHDKKIYVGTSSDGFTPAKSKERLGERFLLENQAGVVREIFLSQENKLKSGLRIPIMPFNLDYKASYDLNNDGVMEHFLVPDKYNYQSEKFKRYELHILDDADYSIKKVVTTKLDHWKNVIFKDVDSDENVDLISYGNAGEITVFETLNFSIKYQIDHYSSENVVSFCDVTNDGLDEVITNKAIRRITGGDVLYKSDDEILTVIKTAGNKCALLLQNADSELLIGHYKNSSMIKILLSEQKINFYKVFNIKKSGSNTNQLLLSTDDRDDFGGYRSRPTLIEIFDNGEVESTFLETDFINNFQFSHIIGSADFNNDGNDEILCKDSRFLAFTINDNKLTFPYKEKSYGSKDYFKSAKLVELADDNSVSIYRNFMYDLSDEQIYNYIGSTLTTDLSNSAYEDVIASQVVDGEKYYYLYEDSKQTFKKVDNKGALLWVIDESVKDVLFIDDMTLLQNDNSIKVVADSDGKVINELKKRHPVKIFPAGTSKNEFFVVYIHSYEIFHFKNGVFYPVYSGGDTKWGNPEYQNSFSEVTMTQFDDDEQMELIFYFNGYKNYTVFDTKNWAVQSLKKSDKAYNPDYMNFSNPVDDLIFSDELNRSSLRYNYLEHVFQLVDKLSGELIFQFPFRDDSHGAIKFRKNEDMHISTVILNSTGLILVP